MFGSNLMFKFSWKKNVLKINARTKGLSSSLNFRATSQDCLRISHVCRFCLFVCFLDLLITVFYYHFICGAQFITDCVRVALQTLRVRGCQLPMNELGGQKSRIFDLNSLT